MLALAYFSGVILQHRRKQNSSLICDVCCPIPELENDRIFHHRKSHSTKECTYVYGDVLSYMCNKQRYFRATCQPDGTWDPKTPSCDPDCSFPPTIAHGRHKSTSYFAKEFVYECDEGYRLVGEAKLSCYASQWSSEAPQCKALCLKPDIKNGKLSVDKYQYLEMEDVTIQCDSGFGMVGSQRITCSENRTWYPAVPKCKWEVPEGCNQVVAGRKLMQCFQNPADVKMALEVYKLSLEIELLELQRDKEKQSVLTQSP